MPDLNGDIVTACADLVGRAGASDFEIGYLDDDPANARWYATAFYRGTRIGVDERRSPTEAALGLAERLLSGATCGCGNTVRLADGPDGCRWRLVGKRWEPGCDVPPVTITGARRGDYAAMLRAMAERAGGADA